MFGRTRILVAAAVLGIAVPLSSSVAQEVPALSAHREAAADWRGAQLPDARMPRMLHMVLREYGYNPDRLSRAERRALDQAHAELFSHRGSFARADLNRAQSVALVYVALVEPGRDRGLPGHGRIGCGDAGERVYDLARLLNESGSSHRLFLSREEQEQARRGARAIQQSAAACGEYRLADQAMDLLALLNTNLAERSRINEQVTRMRRTLQEHGGRR